MRKIVLFILMLGAFLVMQTENIGLSPPEITCEQSYNIDATDQISDVQLISCYMLVNLEYDLQTCKLDLMTQEYKETKPMLVTKIYKPERVAIGVITRSNFISTA
ncbi:MAG: hypothetical protein QM487_14310 [Candidatus Marithrix sp.]